MALAGQLSAMTGSQVAQAFAPNQCRQYCRTHRI
jgi:hypothetical protein